MKFLNFINFFLVKSREVTIPLGRVGKFGLEFYTFVLSFLLCYFICMCCHCVILLSRSPGVVLSLPCWEKLAPFVKLDPYVKEDSIFFLNLSIRFIHRGLGSNRAILKIGDPISRLVVI